MAVYYKYIKGCAPGSTLSTGQWSYIYWGSGNTGGIDSLPTLECRTGSNDSSKNLGYFLTNNAKNITIEQPWTFNKNIDINDCISIKQNIPISFDVGMGWTASLTSNTEDNSFNIKNEAGINIFAGQEDRNIYIHTARGSGLKILPNDYKNETDNLIIAQNKNVMNKPLTINDGYCEAQYFNATSDLRAKENIKPFSTKALNLIDQLQIYTFNYKNHQDKVPGILAQELLNVQGDLNLVNNEQATGENGDYMTIKEDKLVYICMKAIKELNEEIRILKEEINNLKHK